MLARPGRFSGPSTSEVGISACTVQCDPVSPTANGTPMVMRARPLPSVLSMANGSALSMRALTAGSSRMSAMLRPMMKESRAAATVPLEEYRVSVPER